MSLKKQIDEKLNQALKAKDKSTYPTLRLVVSAIKDAEIAARTKGQKEMADSDIMAILKKRVLGDGIPFLGICVGLQLLADLGHDNKKNSPGLGGIGGHVKRIPSSPHNFRVPHMGWNSLVFDKQHELVKGLPRLIDMYFLHSYHLELNDKNYRVAHVSYSSQLTAIVAKGNISGTQFHPEKSQAAGQKFIENFLCWNP